MPAVRSKTLPLDLDYQCHVAFYVLIHDLRPKIPTPYQTLNRLIIHLAMNHYMTDSDIPTLRKAVIHYYEQDAKNREHPTLQQFIDTPDVFPNLREIDMEYFPDKLKHERSQHF